MILVTDNVRVRSELTVLGNPKCKTMKRIKSLWWPLFLGLATVFVFTQCEKDEVVPQAIFVVGQNGYSQFNQNALRTQLNTLPKEDLTADEEAGLVFMREEEKLAHDVYYKLYESWKIQVFSNIAASELTHTEAVLLLLEKYDLTDPVGNNGIGTFVDQTLQTLYNDLLVQGQLSEIDALKVGAIIEEVDILDLEDQLNNVVDNQDITLVYTNLQKGSRNHLRAFVHNLANRGVTYEPIYLSQDEYEDIILSDMENGRN